MPTIPDWALDGTHWPGQAMGAWPGALPRARRKLIPPPEKDAYEDEAYRLLALKRGKVNDLFDEA